MSRALARNVNFYDGATGTHLGGVKQNGSITNANFFHMLMDILLDVDGIVSIRSRETGQLMPLNTDRLEVGDYDLFCLRGESFFGNILMSNQANLTRQCQTD